jgi:hypothetical protein
MKNMLHLLKIEILKLQRNRSFLILMVLFAISLFGVNYIVSEIMRTNPIHSATMAFPNVWILVPYISSFLLVILCFTIIMHTCSEYTYRTNRQNVIDGLSRNQYITTKILFVIALALFSTILTFITAFVIGISSDSAISFKDFRYMHYFFVQAMAYLSFAFLFALLLKKSALSIGVFFIYSLIIENILERYINKIDIGAGKMGGFLPLSSSDHLLLPDSVKTVLKMVNMGDSQPEYLYLIMSIVYIVLCYLVCYYRYEKQDL